MTHASEDSTHELVVLLAYHQQLLELSQAADHRLETALAERAREECMVALTLLSRLVAEVKSEIVQMLQTPIHPGTRRLCRQTFRE